MRSMLMPNQFDNTETTNDRAEKRILSRVLINAISFVPVLPGAHSSKIYIFLWHSAKVSTAAAADNYIIIRKMRKRQSRTCANNRAALNEGEANLCLFCLRQLLFALHHQLALLVRDTRIPPNERKTAKILYNQHSPLDFMYRVFIERCVPSTTSSF